MSRQDTESSNAVPTPPPLPFHGISPPSLRRKEGPVRGGSAWATSRLLSPPQPQFPSCLVRGQTEQRPRRCYNALCLPPFISACRNAQTLSGAGRPQFPQGDLSLEDQSPNGLETVKANRTLWPQDSPASLWDSDANRWTWEAWVSQTQGRCLLFEFRPFTIPAAAP